MENNSEFSKEQNVAVKLFLEYWKFMRNYVRLLQKLPLPEQQRYISQLNFSYKQTNTILSEVGLKTVNLEGAVFDHGHAVVVINLTDFSSEAKLIIDTMLEPIILDENDKVLREGTVLVKEVQHD